MSDCCSEILQGEYREKIVAFLSACSFLNVNRLLSSACVRMSGAGSTPSHILCTVRVTQHKEGVLGEFPFARLGMRQMKKMIHRFYDFDKKEKKIILANSEVYYKRSCCICILYFFVLVRF